MSPEKLTMMANQIATFFRSQPGTDQPQRIAAHINDFWEPRMRAQLAAHVADGASGLDPLVIAAMDHIRLPPCSSSLFKYPGVNWPTAKRGSAP
ncbi:formate dehydrogenase subunit delta [Lacimonas salitolerans]|uniref:Formate dehydrogenase subunit delta n=1 Tax=Lacimonas salitolerans TaxID=1323750 RepID=A0ABW4EJW1_9RHOB